MMILGRVSRCGQWQAMWTTRRDLIVIHAEVKGLSDKMTSVATTGPITSIPTRHNHHRVGYFVIHHATTVGRHYKKTTPTAKIQVKTSERAISKPQMPCKIPEPSSLLTPMIRPS